MADLSDKQKALALIGGQLAAVTKWQAPPPATPERNMGLDLEPGQRVFDLISGQEGTILAGSKTSYQF
jgi:hypothetical protein